MTTAATKLPTSDTLERIAVAAALSSDDTSKALACDLLQPECFYSPQRQIWFEYACTHKTWDFQVACDELKGRYTPAQVKLLVEELEACMDAEQKADLNLVCSRLQHLAASREAIIEAQRVAADGLTSAAADPAGFLERSDALREKRQHRRLIGSRLAETFEESLGRTTNNLRASTAATRAARGVLTQLEPVDYVLRGLKRKKLYIVAARPSVGKSALAQQVAMVAAKQGRVLFFSLEMDKEEVNTRALAMASGIDSSSLEVSGDMPESQWKNVLYAFERLRKHDFRVYDDVLTIEQIRAVSRQELQLSGDLALVVVDYLQLVQTRLHKDMREQQVSHISRTLKLLAKELDVPVLACAQINRKSEAENRRPMISDLRESGAIEQDADAICLMHREDYQGQAKKGSAPPPPQSDISDVEIIIAKNRAGKTGTARVRFHKSCSRFSA